MVRRSTTCLVSPCWLLLALLFATSRRHWGMRPKRERGRERERERERTGSWERSIGKEVNGVSFNRYLTSSVLNSQHLFFSILTRITPYLWYSVRLIVHWSMYKNSFFQLCSYLNINSFSSKNRIKTVSEYQASPVFICKSGDIYIVGDLQAHGRLHTKAGMMYTKIQAIEFKQPPLLVELHSWLIVEWY